MARKKSQEIIRRTVTAQRTSEEPALRVQADLDSSRGYSAIGQAATSVFSRLGEASARAGQVRREKQDGEDAVKGAQDRTTESLAGTPAQQQAALAERTAGYRRGYFLTEASNKLFAAKTDIAREVAKLEPGEDITPIMAERFGALLQDPAFQDPEVMRKLQPQIAVAQQEIAAQRNKTELAEIFDRQSENLSEMARTTIQSGGLRTPEQIEQFRASLDTEQFAYISKDEADDILATAYANLFETGQVDPEEAVKFLQTKLPGDDVPLWDRTGWTEKFETAISAGATIRQKAYEEQQANTLSGMEYQLQGKAERGALGIGEINALADKVGLQGKERLAFTRRWIDQNQAGLRHQQSEARRAKEHRETIAAITAGNAMSLTDSQLKKSAEKEWAAAVNSGDQATKASVILRYTRAGIVIPQLQDMLNRTTRNNLTANYELYANLAKIDPVVADRYTSEANATMFAMHHDNITKFGMTPQESINALPTGATKGRREDVAREVSTAATRYFKDNPTIGESPRTRAINAQIEQQAIRLGLANPDASAEDNLRVAERRVMGGLITVNGRLVPRGGARPTAEPAIDSFVREGADDLVKAGVIPAELREGVYAAPTPGNPNRFALLLPSGYPVAHPKTGRPITFDPMEVAQVRHDYDAQRKDRETRRAQEVNQNLRVAPAPVSWGTADTPGALSALADDQAAAVKSAQDKAETQPFPSFMEFLQDHRTERKRKGN